MVSGTNNFTKDKVLCGVSLVVISLGLAGMLSDTWWEVGTDVRTYLGLYTKVSCGMVSLQYLNQSVYICFEDEKDQNGWVVFVRIMAAFGIAMIAVSLLLQLIYVCSKKTVVRMIASVFMAVAGFSYLIVNVTMMERYRNLSKAWNPENYYILPQKTLRFLTLPLALFSLTFVLAVFVSVGFTVDVNPKPRLQTQMSRVSVKTNKKYSRI